MTDIDVPDWVVEVACSAAFVEFSDNQRADMRAALAAALGAWVVPVGYASRKAIAAVSTTPFYGCDTYISAAEQTIVACEPLYTLRKEKPDSENIQHLVDAIANVYRPL